MFEAEMKLMDDLRDVSTDQVVGRAAPKKTSWNDAVTPTLPEWFRT
ncbi:hypothetical protein ACFTWD_03850 [Streptomyces sp. NPDC056943]